MVKSPNPAATKQQGLTARRTTSEKTAVRGKLHFFSFMKYASIDPRQFFQEVASIAVIAQSK